MMGGVNNAADYISRMKFGHTELKDGEPTPVVTDSLLQGGIVSVYYLGEWRKNGDLSEGGN